MASNEHRPWPVRAWIRIALPPSDALPVLMGPPPPPEPPGGDLLERLPAGPDPRKRLYAFEEPDGEGILRVLWDSDEPERLQVELRLPEYGTRIGPERLRAFWSHVRERLAPMGPLRVESADPRP
ncbi:MAG: hypothetical protein L3K04_01880 [Thermoplasmata archaeon]|nr:hypothetical protein [Thermoplasmata archaeon]